MLTDIQSGKLAQVSFVTPDKANSDHAGAPDGGGGPDWVGSIVNAVAQNPALWSNTAIIVSWDDWGGWYDHVPPPCAGYADCDFMGPGFRVPLIVISPYAKAGYVSHQIYDIASIPATIEQRFNLPALTNADMNAPSFWNDCFNFNQQPLPPPTIQTQLKAQDFKRRPHSYEPPDD